MRILTVAVAFLLAVTLAGGCGPSTPPAPGGAEAKPAASEAKPMASEAKPAASEAKPEAKPAAPGGKELLSAGCTKCHDLERVKNYSGQETWQAIVDRMINQRGAKVTTDDARRIVAYLNETFPRK